jgi:nicotinamide-nucleotide amidase
VSEVASGELVEQIVEQLVSRHLRIAIAESLTGGLLVAEFVRVPGVSAVLNGGVVAYNVELKHTLLGVDAALLARHGAVHPDVAAAMALGVRDRLAVAGRPASIGMATTGVAGPGQQDGQPVGTVFVGIAIGEHVHILRLSLDGSRDDIRRTVVSESLVQLGKLLASEF